MFIDATTPIGFIARLARRHNEPSIIARSKERLADIAGGHDPSNPVIFEGWLQKQAVSAQFNKNWRYRYIIVRCDRIEWHADKPTAEQLPRGYVKLASAIVEPAPQTFGSGWKTFGFEVAIVVVGVVIALFGNHLVTVWNREAEMEQSMEAIENDLLVALFFFQ